MEDLIPLCNLEVSTTPPRELPRLVIGTAIPREAGTLAGGAAAVRKGSETKIKPREKRISGRTMSVGAWSEPTFGSDYEP